MNVVKVRRSYVPSRPPASGELADGQLGVNVNDKKIYIGGPGNTIIPLGGDYQTTTFTGDATGSGITSVALTLSNSGVVAGTYTKVTVDSKGRVTVGANPTTLSGYGITDALNSVSGGSVSGNITMTSGATVTGLPLPINGSDAVNFDALSARALASTSLYVGGLVTINADPTKVDIAAGTALFMDYTNPVNPTSQRLAFGPFIAVAITNIATQPSTYLGLNSSLAIVQQATPFTSLQRRTIVPVGLAIHTNNVIVNVINQLGSLNRSTLNQLQDFIDAIGPLNTNGNKYVFNGANLNINKSLGTLFKYGANTAVNPNDPNVLSLSAQTALTFRYRQANSTEGADTTAINPALYDNAGVLTAVPATRFTIQYVYLFQTNLTRIQYGQTLYVTMADALAAISTEQFTVEANMAANGIPRCHLIVKGNATDLSNSAQAMFIEIQKFGNPSAGGSPAITFTDVITALGFTPVNDAGDTLSGTLNLAPPVTIAAGATTNIAAAASNSVTIIGTGNINAFGTIASGAYRDLTFSGTPNLSYNATSMILPGAADIQTVAGDTARFVSLGSGNWKCVSYQRAASGAAILPASDSKVGYLGRPQNSKSANYTTVLADSGKHIYHPSADTNARTFTIAANSSVPYDIGTELAFVNDDSAGVVTIAINTDTMTLAGTGTTGNRTLAANGVATARKITATRWIIWGTGLT